MSKILIDDEWYDEISYSSLYEAEFERVILQKKHLLFPDYTLVPFKLLVSDDERSARADMAMVHNSYSHWWVVEVEMGRHSLSSHVLPQVTTLSRANYLNEAAEYLHSKDTDLDIDKLAQMVKGDQPNVMVMVDSPQPSWTPELRPHGAIVTVVQLFRSKRNKHIVRLNGQSPEVPSHFVSHCLPVQELPRMLTLSSPAALRTDDNGRVQIYYQGHLTDWKKLETADTIWLTPVKNSPLTPGRRYSIVVDSHGVYHFQE